MGGAGWGECGHGGPGGVTARERERERGPGPGRPASRAPGAGTAVEVVSAVIISLAGVSAKLGEEEGGGV